MEALLLAATPGRLGESYCAGDARDHCSPSSERTNKKLVEKVCSLMDQFRPQEAPHARLITPVVDRPGHDKRYAIYAFKISQELGWKPRHSFDQGLEVTVSLYLQNLVWCQKDGYSGSKICLDKKV